MDHYRVLVVDDDDVDRMMACRALRAAPMEVSIVQAASVSAGLEAIRQQDFDCVLLDYHLPDGDGLSMLKAMREAGTTLPVIMLTGQGDERLAVELIRAGASDYLPKDMVSMESLSHSLQTAVRVYRAEEALKESDSRLQEVQGQLLQSEKMASIGQLAAGVAHEINNPVGYINSNMASMQGYVDELFRLIDGYEAAERTIGDKKALAEIRSIKEEVTLEFLRDDVQGLLEQCQEGLSRVKQIVQDLKSFAHTGSGKWEPADLHQCIDSTLNVCNSEIKYRAEVVREYGELPQVECIPSQLNQVFMNLLVNAAHAIGERGTITLRTGSQGDQVWVEVADTGEGIDPDNLKRLFDPFFTTKPVGKGTGLGLSLSYGIIKKHGGRIDVQSRLGEGSAFRVWVPIRRPEVVDEQAA